MRPTSQFLAAFILGLSVCSISVFAGVDDARKYIEEATEKIKAGDSREAATALQLAETELEGVDAAAAAPLKQQIETLKKSMGSAEDAESKRRLTQEVESGLRNTKDSIGIVGTFDDNAKNLLDLVNDPESARLLGADEVAKIVKQVESFKKVHAKQAIGVYSEEIERRLKYAEEQWPGKKKDITDGSPNSKDGAIQDMTNNIGQAHTALEKLPADNDSRKAFEARLAKVENEFNQLAGEAASAEVLESLKRGWEIYKEEWDGWDKENSPPTFEQFIKQSGGDIEYLNAPKTANLISRAAQFFDNRKEDESYKTAANVPAIKAYMENITKMRDDARAKMVKFSMDIMDQAEKVQLNDDVVSALSRLSGGGARGTFHQVIGDDAPQLKGLVDRAESLVNKQKMATEGAENARKEAYAALTTAAAKAWPDMKAKFTIDSGFDPANPGAMKGKLITITTDNLMGYRFKPGDFPFATTLNGMPIACRYDSDVAKAVAEIEKKIGRGLGDSDDDGKWEIICRVEGNTGQLMSKREETGDVKVDGTKVGTVTAEYAVPVTAPIVTIVAAHCGPLAVASGAGVVHEDGKVEAPKEGAAGGAGMPGSGGGSGGGSGWLWKFVTLVVGLAAAGTCLMKANFAPLASIPQAGQVQAKLGGEMIGLIGLLCAAIGVVFLLKGFLFYGALTSLAIIAAGSFAGLDFLQQRGLVKPVQAQQIRAFGVPIGLVCAVLTIISVISPLIGLNTRVI